MSAKIDFPKLSERTTVLGINFLISYIAFSVASGLLLPTGGLESAWLLSAYAMWFLNLLSAPWFLPPRDALANAVTATAILVTMDLTPATQFQHELNVIRWIYVGYCSFVALVAVFALLLSEKRDSSARLTFRLTGIIGKGEILYTGPVLISLVGAYQADLNCLIWLIVLWVFLVVVQPIERASSAIRIWRRELSEESETTSVGTIFRIDHPNIVRVKLYPNQKWLPNVLHIAAMPDGEQRYLLSLFSQVLGDEVIGTGIVLGSADDIPPIAEGQVRKTDDVNKANAFIERMSALQGASILGFVVENSSISGLRFEVTSNANLEEGTVVFSRLDGRNVFYQILDAETAEETFDKNPHGTQIAMATQLGCYSPESGFTKFPWLPKMNTPLFSADRHVFADPVQDPREFEIGKVPSTNIGVVANIDDLVEYHSAILGVTGTGKTELALDVIRQALQRDVKVFCVDFTGEYKQRLSDLNPIFPSPTEAQGQDLEAKLFAADTGQYGAGAEKRILKEATDQLRAQTDAQIDAFLRSPDENLAVFELAEIANTKASLRLTEMYLTSIMTWARANRRARQVLLVLEEAHTIIPEAYASGFDYDTQWVVSKIGQIALQGRKYGVGLLVISQRTALVSKTILSQCNTFLTHSLIDQTSLGFLESVYSHQHTRLIPNLGQFEFLAFGKALKSERPILLKRPFDPAKKAASEALKRPIEADG